MECKTLPEKQENKGISEGSTALSSGQDKAEEKVSENVVDVEPVVVKTCPSAVAVHEPLVLDLTLFSYEVQQGYRIFRELLSDQYKSVTYPFIDPVDVEGLNLWDYHARIETPMSFSQIESKFKSYGYQSITEIASDLRLILENCYRYNGSTHWISKLAHKLEKIIDQKLALLNRSLREKVTLRATMAFRNKKEIGENIPEIELSGRRRRSGRTSYAVNGMKSEESSSLMNHLLMEEEESQREIKRLKDKEKKEANEALMQELSEWENEIFTNNVLGELKSMWEIPSIGSFLWLFQTALNLPELNFTEFEYGFVLPHKSQQMAWIFTSLLATSSQRKSLHKRSPMKFKVWERKLKERIDVWYLARQDEELQMVARQIGLNPTFFDVLGESNPLETKSYIDLTLHQRVLILKVLCDECLDYHPQLRDSLGNTDTTPYSETYLGYDADNSTYLYFPIFDATDIRVYKQSELPAFNEWYRKWTSNSRAYRTPKRTNQSKSRRSSNSKTSKKGQDQCTSIEPGFELVCNDVESLRELCEKFAEHSAMPSRKNSGGRPTRKRSEKQLHKVLGGLVEELGKSDARYTRARVKGMVNLMKDWKAVEEMSDSGDEFNVQDGEVEEPAGESLQSPQDSELPAVPNNTSAEQIPGEGTAPLLTMVTRSRNRKRRFLDNDDMTSASSSPLSEISKNFESESGVLDDSKDWRIGVSSEKRPTLDDDVMKGNEICDVIVRDVVNNIISDVLASEDNDVLMNGVDNGGQRGTIVARSGNKGDSEDKLEVVSNGVEVEKTVDHRRVSMGNKVQQLIETNGGAEGNRDTPKDMGGFDDLHNHSAFTNEISNGYATPTNGSIEGLEELHQNIDVCKRNIDTESDHSFHKTNEVNTCTNICEQKANITSQHQNCPGTQVKNGGITSIAGTNVYSNGQCGEATDDCNGVLWLDSNSGTNIPTGKEPTVIIPAKSLPGKKIPAGTIPSETTPSGIARTIIEPAGN